MPALPGLWRHAVPDSDDGLRIGLCGYTAGACGFGVYTARGHGRPSAMVRIASHPAWPDAATRSLSAAILIS
tara:strand:+ start:806 stop:1021 length:216 start_codon:yes stop_codon:yes gene_type:complete